MGLGGMVMECECLTTAEQKPLEHVSVETAGCEQDALLVLDEGQPIDNNGECLSSESADVQAVDNIVKDAAKTTVTDSKPKAKPKRSVPKKDVSKQVFIDARVIQNSCGGMVGVSMGGFGVRVKTDEKLSVGDVVKVGYYGEIGKKSFRVSHPTAKAGGLKALVD